tara:strand:- start:318 stop:1055 length:738 start_codon:yes stop_codon:yes gene_type:complete
VNEIFKKNEFDKPNFDKRIVFICDHASHRIPKEFANLGLGKKYLKTHISWDIGVKKLCINLAKRLKQSYFMSNFSRLIIDPNRNKNSKELIVENSFDVEIPANKNICLVDKNNRIKNIYDVYHSNLEQFVKKKISQSKKLLLISIHSFTKFGKGFDRGIEIGLLWNKNINLQQKLYKKLLENQIHTGNNYPYSGFFYNYTLDRVSNNGKIDNLCVEIRNDLICDSKGIKKKTNLLCKIFGEILNE